MSKKRKKNNRKVHLHVVINEEIYHKVRELASKVYECHRGALSYAVEEALELWLAAHAKTHRVNPKLPLRERYNAVMECIELEQGYIPYTIHQSIFEKCIMNSFDVKDSRTVYGWLHRFYNAGLIKPLTIEKVDRPSDWSRNKMIEIVAKKI